MENSTKTENTIDLRRLWMLLRTHIWAIIAWAVGLGAVGFVLAAFVVEPKYTSTTQILVNQKRNAVDAGQVYNAQQADVQVINTYKDIVTSPVILKDASKWIKNPTEVVKPAKKAKYKTLADGTKKLVRPAEPAVIRRAGRGYNVSAKEMQKAVSVTTQQQSQVFTISAKSNDPEKSQAIANAVAQTFKNKIKSIMNVNNVTIVSPASRGAKTLVISSLELPSNNIDFVINIPHTSVFLSPIVSIIPFQLLSYFISKEKGLDVDKPRNLAKSVTVE